MNSKSTSTGIAHSVLLNDQGNWPDGNDYGLSHLCKCGCGMPAVPGQEHAARQLAAARLTKNNLEQAAFTGGKHTVEAKKLLWEWSRCEEGMETFVHDRQNFQKEIVFSWLNPRDVPAFGWLNPQGVPTSSWLNSWLERAAEIRISVQEAGRRSKKKRNKKVPTWFAE